MSRKESRTHYGSLQIALHWGVAVLVVGQRYTAASIYLSENPFLQHKTRYLVEHAIHNYAGMLIGLFMFVRLTMRLLRHLKQEKSSSHSVFQSSANIVHKALYLIIILQFLTGLAAAYYWHGAGAIHSTLWIAFLIFVAIHIAGAAYHAYLKDGVISRMLPFLRL